MKKMSRERLMQVLVKINQPAVGSSVKYVPSSIAIH